MIASRASRHFYDSGPLHRPPNLLGSRKNPNLAADKHILDIASARVTSRKNRRSEETDETLVTYMSVRDIITNKGTLTMRVITMWFVVGALCIASFSTANLIIDAFDLKPYDIATASQQSLASQQLTPDVDFGKRFAEIRQVLLGVSDARSLSTLHTPQLKALDWLANRDGMQLSINATNIVQRYSLAVMYYSTDEAGWLRPMNWLTDQHECEWKEKGGVRSCSDTMEVTDISLWNNLKGTIPTELFKLSKLKILYLARNKLYGTIPTEIGLLTELEYLGLHHNFLNGTLPSDVMGNMKKLRSIYVEKNEITGTIRRIDPLCQLRTTAKPAKGQLSVGGALTQVTADCKSLVTWKPPQVACGCCTKCYL